MRSEKQADDNHVTLENRYGKGLGYRNFLYPGPFVSFASDYKNVSRTNFTTKSPIAVRRIGRMNFPPIFMAIFVPR